MYFTILLYFPLVVSAAGNEATNLFQEFSLPGVGKWDGIPFHHFRSIWWVALCTALGAISIDSYSLLQTARFEDEGSPGNPSTSDQGIQSQHRNQLLFCAILSGLESNSAVYHQAMQNFFNDGRSLFYFLYEYGHLPYTPTANVATQTTEESGNAVYSDYGIYSDSESEPTRHTRCQLFTQCESDDNDEASTNEGAPPDQTQSVVAPANTEGDVDFAITVTDWENTYGITWGDSPWAWRAYREACDLPHPSKTTSKTYDNWLVKRNEQKKSEPNPPTVVWELFMEPGSTKLTQEQLNLTQQQRFKRLRQQYGESDAPFKEARRH